MIWESSENQVVVDNNFEFFDKTFLIGLHFVRFVTYLNLSQKTLS